MYNCRFCYTARGGFCYSEDDILEFRTGYSLLLYVFYIYIDSLNIFAQLNKKFLACPDLNCNEVCDQTNC